MMSVGTMLASLELDWTVAERMKVHNMELTLRVASLRKRWCDSSHLIRSIRVTLASLAL